MPKRTNPLPQIVVSEAIPLGTVALVNPGEYLDVTRPNGDVQQVEIKASSGVIMRGLRHDCQFPHCQLSLGHPPTHCCKSQNRPGVYLMVDDDGKILREL